MEASAITSSVFGSMQFMVFAALTVCFLIVLGFAALFGGDHDADHDADHDVDGHEGGPSLISFRGFCAFMLGFCATGGIATAYGFGMGGSMMIGVIPGILMALLVWKLSSLLYGQQSNSAIRSGQAIGASGMVTSTINPGQFGEVDVTVGGRSMTYTATSTSKTERLTIGTMITVESEFGGRVVVKRKVAVAPRASVN